MVVGVQCMASLGLKKYPGTSGGKKACKYIRCALQYHI